MGKKISEKTKMTMENGISSSQSRSRLHSRSEESKVENGIKTRLYLVARCLVIWKKVQIRECIYGEKSDNSGT
jgi:hypothetical protein